MNQELVSIPVLLFTLEASPQGSTHRSPDLNLSHASLYGVFTALSFLGLACKLQGIAEMSKNDTRYA